MDGGRIVRTALTLLTEYQLANDELMPARGTTSEVIKWCPPPQNMYKVNVDGAGYSHRKQAGVVVVIRDGKGEVVAVLCKRLANPLGAMEIEAKAMEEGIRFARDVGIRHAVFEGGSLTICNTIQGLSMAPASVQNITNGILQQAQSFRMFAFYHVKQQENVATHVLAQHAVNVEDYIAWLEECPDQIAHVCAQDVLPL